VRTGGPRPVGAAAAGAPVIEVCTSTRGVAGTLMRPRVGRSRPKVTTSSTVTSRDTISTVGTPRPNIARCSASAAVATAAPTTSISSTAVGTRLVSPYTRLAWESNMSLSDSTYNRGALSTGAASRACPASAHSRLSSRPLAATSRRCSAVPGTVSVMAMLVAVKCLSRARDSVRTGSASVWARRYVVPIALAAVTTSDRRDS
jgi:hypothetical protein